MHNLLKIDNIFTHDTTWIVVLCHLHPLEYCVTDCQNSTIPSCIKYLRSAQWFGHTFSIWPDFIVVFCVLCKQSDPRSEPGVYIYGSFSLVYYIQVLLLKYTLGSNFGDCHSVDKCWTLCCSFCFLCFYSGKYVTNLLYICCIYCMCMSMVVNYFCTFNKFMWEHKGRWLWFNFLLIFYTSFSLYKWSFTLKAD
jgi:hypothetical protein